MKFLPRLSLAVAVLLINTISCQPPELNQDESAVVITPIPLDFPANIAVRDFNITDPGVLTKFFGYYKNVNMKGMNQMTMEGIKFNLEWMHADVVFKVPRLEIDGLYAMTGQYMLIPFQGRGHFAMELKDVKINVIASLKRGSDNTFQISSIVQDMSASKVRGNFPSLFGRQHGAVFSDIVHMMRKHISSLVYDHMKVDLLKEIETGMTDNMDKMLKTMPQQFIDEKTQAKFDFLIDVIRKEIIAQHHDPLHLDDVKEDFDQDLKIFRFNGELDLKNRTVYGLSTIFRQGHVFAHYDFKRNSIIFDSNLGFENMTSTNVFKVMLLDRPGPKGSSEITVNDVIAHMRIRQHLAPGSKPVLEDFKITGVKKIWVDIKGLGSPWDSVVETLVNVISNSFKSALTRVISGPLKKVLQSEIDKLHFGYFFDQLPDVAK
jgi:hypothetical protein